jgi:hypothetical protein
MLKKIYKYLTIDDEGNNPAWIWTTKDLFKNEDGYWISRGEDMGEVGTPVGAYLIPPALREKAKTQVVRIEPIEIVILERW